MASPNRAALGRMVTSAGEIAIGGHRGVGENLWHDGGVFPEYRENTIKSFKRAAEAGASFVEFDVQVTKDGVPVIWHDEHIIFGPASDPTVLEIKDLTLAEFQGLCMQPPDSLAYQVAVLRMFKSKQTRSALAEYSKWTCAVDDTFPTLEAVFNALPDSVGFDIEVKMSTGDDVERTPAAEVERMLSAIWRTVEQCTKSSSRTIVFSSFDPDVCHALATSQSSHPVYFLSGCGHYEHVDPRRTSIHAAIEVAADSRLAGIVLPAAVLMEHPETVMAAAQRGLAVCTYGLENNDAEVVRRQCGLGVQAAIADDVPGLVSALQACY